MGLSVKTGMIVRLEHYVFIFLAVLFGLCAALDVNVSIKVPVPANEETPAITAETFVTALPPTFSVVAVVEATNVRTLPSICPSGYFCLTRETTPEPCPLGTYNPLPGAQNESQCEICPPGQVCGVGTTEPVNCSAGTFREQWGGGSLETDCYDCYAGSYCVSGSVYPVACVAGTVRATPGGSEASSCSLCPMGYWCGENTSVPTACSAGTFRSEPGGISAASCQSCLLGSYCLQGVSNSTPCPSGTYSNSTGATVCLPCTVGHVCPEGTVAPVPCYGGTYRNGTSGISHGDCSPCTIGHYCLNGSIMPKECAIGTYQTAMRTTACDLCIPGEYQPNPAMNFCDTCGAGTYLTGSGMTSISDCVACSTGSYQTGFGMGSSSDCTPCAGNSYCPTPTTVFLCPNFSHSPNGTSVVTSCVCDPGYEGPNGGPCAICNTTVWCRSGTPNVCPQDSLVNAPGGGALSDCMCLPGFFGFAMNTIGIPCAVCQENSYCEGGAANLTLECPYGEYSPSGAMGVSACFCPGNASSGPGATNYDMCTCNPRFKRIANYSTSLTGWECAPCGPNEVCYNDTSMNCPAHSRSAVAVASYNQCLCNAGYYHGSHPEYDLFCSQCDANFYCTGDSTRTQCNAFMVSPPFSVNVSACYCADGYVGKGNDTCTPCPIGYYCTLGDAFQCPSFSTSALRSTTLFGCQCLPGYWGPNGGSCRACLPGTTKQFTGCVNCSNLLPMDCSSCPMGSYSNITANGAPCDLCSPGTYLDATGSLSLAACKTCTMGTYQTGWGFTACAYCWMGTYATGLGMTSVSNCSNCSVGTYQTGMGMLSCINCNPGSYSAQSGVTVCVLCNAGTFSSVVAATASSVCTTCPYASYAASGATNCTSCPAFSNTTTPGARTSSQCTCNSGYYGNTTIPLGAVGLSSVSGLAAYYRFGIGSFLSDTAGLNVPLTWAYTGDIFSYSVPPYSGAYGSAQFNTVGYLQHPSISFPVPGSLCVWVNGQTQQGTLASGTAFSITLSGHTFVLSTDGSGMWTYFHITDRLYTFTGNSWFHVCLPCSGSACYPVVNGAQLGNFPGSYTTSNANLVLGQGFNGGITDLMVFGRQLSNTEISYLYTNNFVVVNQNCAPCVRNSFCTGGLSVQSCPNQMYTLPTALSVDQCVCPANSGWIQGYNCTCNPGYYKVNNTFALGGWQCVTCPVASYCYLGIQTTCPLNSLSLASSFLVTNCTGCLSGYIKVADMNCIACKFGYYCPNMTTEIICPVGRYCPSLATAPIQCDTGYYYSFEGAMACIPCPSNAQSTADFVGCVCNPRYYGAAYGGPIARTGGFNVSQYSSGGVNYSVTTFLSSGTITFRVPTQVDVLVVGGGGGGGWNAGGGGGGGGVIYQESVIVPAGIYQVTVGSGGLGSNLTLYTSNLLNMTNGGASSLFGATANGGGGGACFINKNLSGNVGGSGGGGAPLAGLGGSSVAGTVTGTILTAPLITGYAGAAASTIIGGGGGGAAGVGQTSDGGVGYSTTLYNGTSIYFSGGGGGGMTYAATRAGVAGAGGGGGGGGYGAIAGGVGGLSGFNLGNSGGSTTAGFGGNAGPNTGGGGGATCQDLVVST